MKIQFYLLLFFCCEILTAQSVVNPVQTSDFVMRKSGNITAKDGVFTVHNDSLAIMSKKSLRLSAGQKCRLSGDFRTCPDGDVTKFGFGVVFVDRRGKVIEPRNICVISGTQTNLAADMKAGSRSVLIENGSRWELRSSVIAFMRSGDAVSAEYTSPVISHIEPLPGSRLWRVYFSLPIRFSCPKGKIIRQHIPANRCILAANGVDSTEKWTHYEKIIDPDELKGPHKAVREAAAGAVIFIYNTPAGSQADLEFKNLKLEVY